MFAVLHSVRHLCGCVEQERSHGEHGDRTSANWVFCGSPKCRFDPKNRT
jgi:hypothetical protein